MPFLMSEVFHLEMSNDFTFAINESYVFSTKKGDRR